MLDGTNLGEFDLPRELDWQEDEYTVGNVSYIAGSVFVSDDNTYFRFDIADEEPWIKYNPANLEERPSSACVTPDGKYIVIEYNRVGSGRVTQAIVYRVEDGTAIASVKFAIDDDLFSESMKPPIQIIRDEFPPTTEMSATLLGMAPTIDSHVVLHLQFHNPQDSLDHASAVTWNFLDQTFTPLDLFLIDPNVVHFDHNVFNRYPWSVQSIRKKHWWRLQGYSILVNLDSDIRYKVWSVEQQRNGIHSSFLPGIAFSHTNAPHRARPTVCTFSLYDASLQSLQLRPSRIIELHMPYPVPLSEPYDCISTNSSEFAVIAIDQGIPLIYANLKQSQAATYFTIDSDHYLAGRGFANNETQYYIGAFRDLSTINTNSQLFRDEILIFDLPNIDE